MSTSPRHLFDGTVQKTTAWVSDVDHELDWHDPHRGLMALRATLHTLRDHLTAEENLDLAAQLPELLRGIYFDGWTLHREPARDAASFVEEVHAAFRHDQTVDPYEVVQAVLRVLERHVSAGEIADVKRVLPHELRELWPELTTLAL